MAKGWRIFLSISAFFFIIILTISILSYRLLNKALPKTDGSLVLNILNQPVEVYRDEYGVPHIFAANESDLFRAAGFVTAQDRLWQMDLNRRVAKGELSEIFGEAAVEHDKFVRIWGFSRTAEKIVEILSPESREALKAYAEGVNAFIESYPEQLPIEFSLLKYKPEKWKIEDSIAFVRLMGWKLSFSWYTDLVLQELVAKLGEKKAREVFPDFPKDGPFILPSSTRPFWTQTQNFINSGMQVQAFLGFGSTHLGSNSWVVAGEKSACGKPLLANDPHLELRAPSVWYEMHLSGGEINVAGVSFPGVPGIVIGHNEHIAWGLTNGMIDDVDFYLEKINPDSTSQYLNGSRWENLESVIEQIIIKDAEPESLQIQFSRNGPIISEIHPMLESRDEAVALRWVGHEPSDELLAYLKIQKSKNWEEFTDALVYYKVPAQNFVFAAANGDIGYHLAGRIPLRNRTNGVLPHEGWKTRGQWLGQVPFEKLPNVLNPPENYIVTANNKMVDNRYPYYLSNLWEPSSRAARIHQLLSEKDKFSLDDFKLMQTDLVSFHAQNILPVVVKTMETAIDSNSSEDLKTIYNLMKDWDGRESPKSVATSIFHAFFLRLTENTLKDEMGDQLFENYIRFGNVPNRVMAALLKKGSSEWFDDVNTPEVENMEDIMRRSLLDAGMQLKNLAGNIISNWAWGEIHTLTMRHPLGRENLLDIIFNIGPFPRGGSTMTLNNSEYQFDSPFEATLGASTRQLVDLCDLNHTLSVITTGQSGQRMSKHYKDQTPLWLEGRYRSMIMGRGEITERAQEHLTLTPW